MSIFAFSLEGISGNIKADDLKERRYKKYAYQLGDKSSQVKGDVPKIFSISAKYPSWDVTDTCLTDEVLIKTIFEGIYDPDEIQASLSNSRFYRKSEESEPWRIVVEFDRQEDEVVETGLHRLGEQFDTRSATDPGELLHIFSLRLMLSKRGYFENDLAAAKEACKKYIDDVRDNGSLPPRSADWRWPDEIVRSHGGVVYWVEPDFQDHFNEIRDHLFASQRRLLEKSYPVIAQELLDTLVQDADKFRKLVSFCPEGEGTYALIPVLTAVEPKKLVEKWMTSSKEQWRLVQYALQTRYESPIHCEKLQDEKRWISEVIYELEKEASNQTGYRKFRLERIIPSIPQHFKT